MPDLYTQLHEYIMDPDRIPYAVLAILLVMMAGIITGPLAGNANPLAWQIYQLLIGRLGDRLDRRSRPQGDLMFRGLMLTIFCIIFAAVLGKISYRFAMMTPFYGMTEIALLSLCLTAGSVWFALLRLYFALEKEGQAKGAFYAVSRSTRVDLNSTDDYGITRTALGFTATSFDKGLVAPVIWYLIGGLPVLFIYSALSALAWRFGKNGFSKGFGRMPLALEKLMGFVPALLSGLLFTAASAMTPTASMGKSLSLWWTRKDKVPYEQGGITLCALAWPLHISLGGPVQDIGGSSLKNAWVGPQGATAKIEHGHLRRGIYLNVVAHLLFLAALGGAYLFANLQG